MFFVAEEISIGCVYKNCFDIMLSYVVRVSLLDTEKIRVRNFLFVGTVSCFYIFLQRLYRYMQVNEYIRLYELLVNDFKKALVQTKHIFRQVYFCKQQAF